MFGVTDLVFMLGGVFVVALCVGWSIAKLLERARYQLTDEDLKVHPSFLAKVNRETFEELAERSTRIIDNVQAHPERLPSMLLQHAVVIRTVYEELREERARAFDVEDDDGAVDALKHDVRLLEVVQENPALLTLLHNAAQLHGLQFLRERRRAGRGR